MALQDVENLRSRLQQDICMFAENGTKIVSRIGTPADATSLRTAANQFRQAAKALDKLDGVMQAMYYLKAN